MSNLRWGGTVFSCEFLGNRGNRVDSNSDSTDGPFQAAEAPVRRTPELSAEERLQQTGSKVHSGSKLMHAAVFLPA